MLVFQLGIRDKVGGIDPLRSPDRWLNLSVRLGMLIVSAWCDCFNFDGQQVGAHWVGVGN